MYRAIGIHMNATDRNFASLSILGEFRRVCCCIFVRRLRSWWLVRILIRLVTKQGCSNVFGVDRCRRFDPCLGGGLWVSSTEFRGSTGALISSPPDSFRWFSGCYTTRNHGEFRSAKS